MTAVAKFSYVRDLRLREMCRQLPCQFDGPLIDGTCGRPDTTWCHSNQSKHGKGGAIKASDTYVAAGCPACHRELDQGRRFNEEEKVARWNRAHRRTINKAMRRGLWPRDIAVPELE